MPAPGSHLPLRPREHAHDVREADVREADPDLADDRARPRALHPLLPLHALLGDGRRGRPAGRPRPRGELDHRHVRGRALPRAVLRQRDRALPGRRADVDPVPLRGAARGRSRTSRPSAASARSAATSARRRARARSSGSSRGTTRRSTRAGSATRAASPTRICTPRPREGSAAQGRPAPLRGDLVGRRARPGRIAPADGARVAGAVGVGDGRAGGSAGAAGAAGPRLRRRRAARAGFAGDRRVPGAALVDPGRRACDRRGRRAGRGARSRRRALDQGGAARPARRSSPSAPPGRTRPPRARRPKPCARWASRYAARC